MTASAVLSSASIGSRTSLSASSKSCLLRSALRSVSMTESPRAKTSPSSLNSYFRGSPFTGLKKRPSATAGTSDAKIYKSSFVCVVARASSSLACFCKFSRNSTGSSPKSCLTPAMMCSNRSRSTLSSPKAPTSLWKTSSAIDRIRGFRKNSATERLRVFTGTLDCLSIRSRSAALHLGTSISLVAHVSAFLTRVLK